MFKVTDVWAETYADDSGYYIEIMCDRGGDEHYHSFEAWVYKEGQIIKTLQLKVYTDLDTFIKLVSDNLDIMISHHKRVVMGDRR